MDAYDRKAYTKRNSNPERTNEGGAFGTVLAVRFFIAASLLLLFLISSQFSDYFPDGISEQIYNQVIDNDFYTKLQNYVMMLLYD